MARAPRQDRVPLPENVRGEIARLEQRLAELVSETETLARIRFLEWKIRKAEEQKAWLEHGVRFPHSPHDQEQDTLFQAMESRLRFEEQEALRRLEEQQHQEQQRLKAEQETHHFHERAKAESARRIEEDTRRHQLEHQRIEAQKQIAQTIARALREDLEG